eukprot:COSAG02_NODE_42277_length_386_cov_0.540070_1_plen_106_part_10
MLLALALLASSLVCLQLPGCCTALPPSNGGGFSSSSLSGVEIRVAPGESLIDAFLLAKDTIASRRRTAAPLSRTEVVLQSGTHRIQQPLQIPSGVEVRGEGNATIS